jgi:hypothetical protein
MARVPRFLTKLCHTCATAFRNIVRCLYKVPNFAKNTKKHRRPIVRVQLSKAIRIATGFRLNQVSFSQGEQNLVTPAK